MYGEPIVGAFFQIGIANLKYDSNWRTIRDLTLKIDSELKFFDFIKHIYHFSEVVCFFEVMTRARSTTATRDYKMERVLNYIWLF